MRLFTKSCQAFRKTTNWLLVKSTEILRRTANSVQKIEITSNRKVQKSFQSYLSNASNKTNMVNNIFQLWKEILSEHLSSISLSGKS